MYQQDTERKKTEPELETELEPEPEMDLEPAGACKPDACRNHGKITGLAALKYMRQALFLIVVRESLIMSHHDTRDREHNFRPEP